MRKPFLFFVIAFIFSVVIFIAHVSIVGDAVWGDGRFYYEYVQKLVVEGKLTANKFSPGASLFWLPFFFLAHLFINGNGQTLPYQILTGVGSIFYGMTGLCLVYLVARKYFKSATSLIAVFGFWLSSNLFFYTAVDPINSHPVSFFLSALALFLIDKSPFFTGLSLGLLALTRNQDVIFFILFLPLMRKGVWRYLLGVLIGILPQVILWKAFFGVFNSPYFIAGERFNSFTFKNLVSALVGTQGGLLYYSPIIILGLLGLFYTKKWLSRLGLIWFIAAVLIISSWHDPVGGEAYGNRLFITGFPFFIIGLGSFINKFRSNRIQIAIGLFALSVINLINILFYLKSH